jgi:hypothetical protein
VTAPNFAARSAISVPIGMAWPVPVLPANCQLLPEPL